MPPFPTSQLQSPYGPAPGGGAGARQRQLPGRDAACRVRRWRAQDLLPAAAWAGSRQGPQRCRPAHAAAGDPGGAAPARQRLPGAVGAARCGQHPAAAQLHVGRLVLAGRCSGVAGLQGAKWRLLLGHATRGPDALACGGCWMERGAVPALRRSRRLHPTGQHWATEPVCHPAAYCSQDHCHLLSTLLPLGAAQAAGAKAAAERLGAI